ncbi:MAG: helix-turn-helix transcriptional regulator [Candidatus Xenobia bacterium]
MAGAETLIRIWEMHRALKCGEPINAKSASRQFDISHRQAQRLFVVLQDRLLAPLAFDRRRNTYYYTDETFDLPTMLMTETEALAVILAHEALLQRQTSPLARRLAGALDRLKSYFPPSVSVRADDLLGQVSYFPMPPRALRDEVLETITGALEQHERVAMEYHALTDDQVTKRRVDFYHLAHVRGHWYGIGYCHLRKAMRTFSLNRIRIVTATGTHYKVPATFSIDEYLQEALGVDLGGPAEHVRMLFDEQQSRWIRECRWHRSQELVDRPGGKVELSLHVRVSTEFLQWVMSFGDQVEVLGPRHVRTEVRKRLGAALGRYE